MKLEPLSLDSAPILEHIKEGYLLWVHVLEHIPKGHRFTLGSRIETKFLDLLEIAHASYYTEREK